MQELQVSGPWICMGIIMLEIRSQEYFIILVMQQMLLVVDFILENLALIVQPIPLLLVSMKLIFYQQ
jgi:hypothetical protein